MRPAVRDIHRGQEGYTLTELLTAMLVGIVVLMAAFTLIDGASSVSATIADRQEAVQRGRMAMEQLTRQLRSQVCLGEFIEPITYGDANSVSFYGDLSDGSKNVERRRITYDPVAKTITEQIYPGFGTYPDLTFSSTPAEQRVILRRVEPAVDGATTVPFLRYYAYTTGGQPGDMHQLAVPLSATNASLVVMVKIAYESRPEGARSRNRDATTFFNDVYVRLADPLRPAEGPSCI